MARAQILPKASGAIQYCIGENSISTGAQALNREKGEMKRKPIVDFIFVAGLIVVTMFLLSIFPASSSFMVNSRGASELSAGHSITDPIDWWPMFHHDLNHTGYSNSKAPKMYQTLWNFTTGSYVESSPAVADGMVFVGSYDDNVYALNATTGMRIWNFTTGSSVFSSPAVADGMVFIGSMDDKVYALNETTGVYIWNFTSGSSVYSSPAVANTMVFVGSYDDNVYAFQPLPLSVSVSPSSVVANVERNQIFTANAVGGTPPYAYQWYLNGTAVSGATNPTWTFTPSLPNSWTVYAVVNDSASPAASVQSNNASVTVVSPTVYIMNDGSIVPSYAPIFSPDNITYSFMGNISYPAYNGIIVEKNNIRIDGTGYTVQGDQTGYGLSLSGSNNVTIENANIQGFSFCIYLFSSSNITVSGNTATANTNEGIVLASSSNNTVNGNTIANGDEGIDLDNSSNNTVKGNDITANIYGIYLLSSSNDTVSGNYVAANGFAGIDLYSSSDNTVSGNNVTRNTNGGIYLSSSTNNTVYHNNFIGNVAQASVDSASLGNAWDNGYPSGGNFWSDYNGTDLYSGPYQNLTGSDGIGDTPYPIDSNNTDHYPLVNLFSTGPLSIPISPNSATLDIGQSALFNSTISGGTLPYTYQWYVNGTAVTGANLSSWTFAPSYSGFYNVYANLTDNIGFVAESNVAPVIVNPPPSVSVSPSAVVIDVGQSQLFTSTVSGGTLPYSYQWYLDSAPVSGANNATWTFTPASSGSYSVYVNVTDGVNFVAESKTAQVTVNPPLTASVSPSSVVMDVGQSQLFTSTVTGGTSPYSYQWYLNAAPVSGAANATWTFTPNSSGPYTVCVNVTDAANFVAESNTAQVTANPPLTVSVSPSSVVMDVGQSQLFTSTVTGGTSPYSYQWYLNAAPVSGATNATWTFTAASQGIYAAYVNVTDMVSIVATSATVPVTVNGQPSVSIMPVSVTLDVGQSQTFASNVTGGTSPYSYQWFMNGGMIAGANSSSWALTSSLPSSYIEIYAEVTDSNGTEATSNIANVNVNASPSVSILPSSIVIALGQSQTFNSTVTGGTFPYAYQWFLNGTAVSGANFSGWVFTPASEGSYTIYANITDSNGVQATSNNATITVGPRTPEVTMTNVECSKTVIGRGYGANVTVTAVDLATYSEMVNITVYANTTIIGSQNVTLPSGNSTDFTFAWNTTAFAYGNYTVSACAVPLTNETNPATSSFTGGSVAVTIMGDVNGDFKVDMKDIALVARAFGSKPGSSNWNPNADVNSDGKIDMKDIALVGRNFGQHYP